MKKVEKINVADCLLIYEFPGLDVQGYTFCSWNGGLSLLHLREWMNLHESLSLEKVLHVILCLTLSLLVILKKELHVEWIVGRFKWKVLKCNTRMINVCTHLSHCWLEKNWKGSSACYLDLIKCYWQLMWFVYMTVLNKTLEWQPMDMRYINYNGDNRL